MADNSIDFAAAFGIESVAAAVIFMILFIPVLGYSIWRVATKYNYVFVFLTLFCAVRVVGFAIRAAIAGSDSAGHNESLAIADQILFGMGFSGLLFAVFSLQGDRERISGVRHQSPIMLLVTNRRIFHLGIVLAIVLIIVGTTMITSTSGDHMGLGNTLRKIGTVVLLVLTITTVFRAGSFISYERTKSIPNAYKSSSFGDKFAGMILSVTCALLLERMIYSTITILTNSSQPEGLWYPLDALPEWLVACLICSPGLVLSRDELEEKDLELDGYRNRPLIPPTVV